MQTHYNVKETVLWFASFEADIEAVTWCSGEWSFRRHRSRACGKTNQAPIQRFNVRCFVFLIQSSKPRVKCHITSFCSFLFHLIIKRKNSSCTWVLDSFSPQASWQKTCCLIFWWKPWYIFCQDSLMNCWTTGQQSSSSSLSPGKTSLTTTVAKFLNTSVCGALDALTPASVHSLWSSPELLNRFCLTILIRLQFSRLVVHLFLPHFFLPLNFLLTCLDTALCEQPASLAMNVCGLPSLWRVFVFWTTVRSAVFPMIV